MVASVVQERRILGPSPVTVTDVELTAIHIIIMGQRQTEVNFLSCLE
jgi:hypothetical protein